MTQDAYPWATVRDALSGIPGIFGWAFCLLFNSNATDWGNLNIPAQWHTMQVALAYGLSLSGKFLVLSTFPLVSAKRTGADTVLPHQGSFSAILFLHSKQDRASKGYWFWKERTEGTFGYTLYCLFTEMFQIEYTIISVFQREYSNWKSSGRYFSWHDRGRLEAVL